MGDPSNGLNDAPLEKINWNAAVQYHPIQCLLFLCKAYHRQPSVSFFGASSFGSERGKTIDQEEDKTENEFTHKEELRDENDATLPNLKRRNFQTKWLNYHMWLWYENKTMFCHFCRLAEKKYPFGGDKGCPCCCLFVPLQGPQRDKLSPEATKLAQTLQLNIVT